jgi:hypothetical protein
MPFSSPSGSGYSEEHFTEVYEDLFVPAISAASFSPVRADTTVLSRHILADLLARIEEAAIVLCDLSAANPNVLFELGWAFRADRPCVLVKDDLTQYPFDLQHAHVTTYHSSLKARLVKSDISEISQLIQNTAADSARRWSLVQSLGLDARLRFSRSVRSWVSSGRGWACRARGRLHRASRWSRQPTECSAHARSTRDKRFWRSWKRSAAKSGVPRNAWGSRGLASTTSSRLWISRLVRHVADG